MWLRLIDVALIVFAGLAIGMGIGQERVLYDLGCVGLLDEFRRRNAERNKRKRPF